MLCKSVLKRANLLHQALLKLTLVYGHVLRVSSRVVLVSPSSFGLSRSWRLRVVSFDTGLDLGFVLVLLSLHVLQ